MRERQREKERERGKEGDSEREMQGKQAEGERERRGVRREKLPIVHGIHTKGFHGRSTHIPFPFTMLLLLPPILPSSLNCLLQFLTLQIPTILLRATPQELI